MKRRGFFQTVLSMAAMVVALKAVKAAPKPVGHARYLAESHRTNTFFCSQDFSSSDWNYTRASKATYYDDDGLLRVCDENVMRTLVWDECQQKIVMRLRGKP